MCGMYILQDTGLQGACCAHSWAQEHDGFMGSNSPKRLWDTILVFILDGRHSDGADIDSSVMHMEGDNMLPTLVTPCGKVERS